MRAVKRERYGKKELERLKKTLGVEDSQPGTSDDKMDSNTTEVITFTTADEIKEKKKNKEIEVLDREELDEIKNFNPKTLRNEKGAYPVWLHPRKIKKVKKTKKKSKGKVTKQSKKK